MASLEEKFAAELKKQIALAKEHGCEQKGLAQNIEKYGALNSVKHILKRRRASEGYLALEEKHLLRYSLEALVVSRQYEALFTDDEINTCFDLLCESGYYDQNR